MYCANCGSLQYGFKNDEGKIKYESPQQDNPFPLIAPGLHDRDDFALLARGIPPLYLVQFF